ncbi:MAG: hypothetical protein WCP79_05485 [Bacillota bacterium]
MNIYKVKIEKAIEQCDIHASVLNSAIDELNSSVDIMNVSDIALIDTWQVLRSLDQIAYRFQRLQDEMGRVLLPSIPYALHENISDDATFVEKLNWLEKNNYLSAAADWIKLRQFRNSLAHEYPGEPQLKLRLLKKLLVHCAEMVAIYTKVKDKYFVSIELVDSTEA